MCEIGYQKKTSLLWEWWGTETGISPLGIFKARMGFWATWSNERCPWQWQGFGSWCSSMSLSIQAIQWFYDFVNLFYVVLSSRKLKRKKVWCRIYVWQNTLINLWFMLVGKILLLSAASLSIYHYTNKWNM